MQCPGMSNCYVQKKKWRTVTVLNAFGFDGCCLPMMALTLLDRILALSFCKKNDRRRRHSFNNSSGEYLANSAANLDTCFSVSLANSPKRPNTSHENGRNR